MEIVIGIDFGTNNTIISFFNDNEVKLLKTNKSYFIPTKIYIDENNKIYCGNQINKNIIKNYKNLIINFKTLLNNNEKILINNKKFSIDEIIFSYLNYIKNLILLKFNNNEKIKIIFSVPSYFDNNKRLILKEFYEKINFKVLRIINEPTAASLFYSYNNITENEEKIMILDMGCGTLDITILEKEDTFFETLDTYGTEIGGKDFTKDIYDHFIEKNNINKNHIIDKLLWDKCKKIKERFYYNDYNIIEHQNIKLHLDKNDFKKIIKNSIIKTENFLKNYKKEIDKIIIIGGSSRLFFIKELVEKIYNLKPIIYKSPQTIVSKGCCLYGAIISKKVNKNSDIILADIVPLSIGIETSDGNFSIIIPKGTKLPTKRIQRYSTNYQENIEIKFYQGERKIAKNNILISSIKFDKLSKVGIPTLIITIEIDVDNLIKIKIVDKKTQNQKNFLIKNNKISDDNIKNIIENIDKTFNEELELSKKNELIFSIKNKIENILNNLNQNKIKDKNIIIDNLLETKNKLEKMNKQELLKIKNKIDDKFVITNKKIKKYDEKKIINLNELNISKNILDENIDKLIEIDYNKIFIKESIEILNDNNLNNINDRIKFINNILLI